MLIAAGDGRGLPMDYDELQRWTRTFSTAPTLPTFTGSAADPNRVGIQGAYQIAIAMPRSAASTPTQATLR